MIRAAVTSCVCVEHYSRNPCAHAGQASALALDAIAKAAVMVLSMLRSLTHPSVTAVLSHVVHMCMYMIKYMCAHAVSITFATHAG